MSFNTHTPPYAVLYRRINKSACLIIERKLPGKEGDARLTVICLVKNITVPPGFLPLLGKYDTLLSIRGDGSES